ncbi:MAG: PAC2 family protein [Actinomycetota bacterium]|nr:PAC2 family protein [Actinomycetota bacterium]
MLDAGELYELAPTLPTLDRPVLLQALDGFIDAGGGVRLAREQLLTSLEHDLVATFDVDQLYDYRARRPAMLFVENRWESYDAPALALHHMRDGAGTSFLLLSGPEPDVQWERFVAAVRQLVERFEVSATIGLNAIPMAVPHTRPIGLTAHATKPELVAGHEPWISSVQVPASVGHVLEYRLGQAGHAALGFAVHVPHYLAQAEYPDVAEALLDTVARASGLVLPTASLRAAAQETRAAVDEQVGGSPEVLAVVRGLEEQYDAVVRGRGPASLLAEDRPLPTADELGAELERFLAHETRRQRPTGD